MKTYPFTNVQFDKNSNLTFEVIDFELEGSLFFIMLDVREGELVPLDVTHMNQGVCSLCGKNKETYDSCDYFKDQALKDLSMQLLQVPSIRLKIILKGYTL